ncbi:hypothetical protein BRC78_04935, partial [Halobacteriales archaeon QH_8_68_33]
ELVPPESVADERDTFLNGVDWSPTRDVFGPRVGGCDVRERIAEVHAGLTEVSGSAGRSRYNGRKTRSSASEPLNSAA